MMMLVLPLLMIALVLWIVWRWRRASRDLRRERFIRTYTLPAHLFETLMKRHGHLQIKDCQLVAQGMRQFFMAYLKSGQRYVSMPSQVVDELWHEFILHTREYERFCQQAFGGLLHHTPAAVLGDEATSKGDAGLRRCWWFACREENINPGAALRLPLLFALDTKLKIADGFHYVVDCSSVRRTGRDGSAVYCGSDFTSGVGSDGAGDSSGSDSSSSDSDGGDSSGCGGGGCGGGGD